MHDRNIFWIVVEDAQSKSDVVRRLLDRITPHLLGSVHLTAITPKNEKLQPGEPSWKKVRGARQINKALNWITENQSTLAKGNSAKSFIYFADDDNTYDIRVFDHIRKVHKIGVWPVAFSGNILYEGPVCDSTKSTVLKWRANNRPDRFYANDMAGFALSLDYFLEAKEVLFSPKPRNTMIENDFLQRLVFHHEPQPEKHADALKYLEPIACDEILVWHTQTKEPELNAEGEVNKTIPVMFPV